MGEGHGIRARGEDLNSYLIDALPAERPPTRPGGSEECNVLAQESRWPDVAYLLAQVVGRLGPGDLVRVLCLAVLAAGSLVALWMVLDYRRKAHRDDIDYELRRIELDERGQLMARQAREPRLVAESILHSLLPPPESGGPTTTEPVQETSDADAECPMCARCREALIRENRSYRAGYHAALLEMQPVRPHGQRPLPLAFGLMKDRRPAGR